ncbi:Uncharacterised protein [Vibrio cholerae]|nr:Uncharacterised protein [Vibrio cholerae]
MHRSARDSSDSDHTTCRLTIARLYEKSENEPSLICPLC